MYLKTLDRAVSVKAMGWRHKIDEEIEAIVFCDVWFVKVLGEF